MSLADWAGYLGLMLKGAWVTVELTVLGCLLALVVAFVVGFVRLARSGVLRGIGVIYVEFFRGTSAFVQLFWAYFVLPLLGVPITPMQAGVLVLGLNVGSYAAEVVRGAVLAIPKEQTEACVALNLTRFQRMRHVLLPQALVIMLPTFGNNAIELLKATAIVSLISVSDLTFESEVVRLQTGNTVIPFMTVLFIYFAFSSIISRSVRRLERRLSQGLEGIRS